VAAPSVSPPPCGGRAASVKRRWPPPCVRTGRCGAGSDSGSTSSPSAGTSAGGPLSPRRSLRPPGSSPAMPLSLTIPTWPALTSGGSSTHGRVPCLSSTRCGRTSSSVRSYTEAGVVSGWLPPATPTYCHLAHTESRSTRCPPAGAGVAHVGSAAVARCGGGRFTPRNRPLLLRLTNRLIAEQTATGADPAGAAERVLHRLSTDGPAAVDDPATA